jgi:hypothetical protein
MILTTLPACALRQDLAVLPQGDLTEVCSCFGLHPFIFHIVLRLEKKVMAGLLTVSGSSYVSICNIGITVSFSILAHIIAEVFHSLAAVNVHVSL